MIFTLFILYMLIKTCVSMICRKFYFTFFWKSRLLYFFQWSEVCRWHLEMILYLVLIWLTFVEILLGYCLPHSRSSSGVCIRVGIFDSLRTCLVLSKLFWVFQVLFRLPEVVLFIQRMTVVIFMVRNSLQLEKSVGCTFFHI